MDHHFEGLYIDPVFHSMNLDSSMPPLEVVGLQDVRLLFLESELELPDAPTPFCGVFPHLTLRNLRIYDFRERESTIDFDGEQLNLFNVFIHAPSGANLVVEESSALLKDCS